MTMRERHLDGYVERGATREAIVVVRRTGGSWRPWNARLLTGPDFIQTVDYAITLAANIPLNNTPERLAEVEIDEIDVAEVWVYPNGQICSSLITMEEEPASL